MPANYVLISEQTTSVTTASVTFSNLPTSGYTDLKVVISARGANSNPFCYVSMGFNGVTTDQSARGVNATSVTTSSFSASNFQFFINGNTSTASTFSNNEFYIPNYRSSRLKSVSLDGVFESNSGSADNNYIQYMADLWSSTSAITSITFTGVTGSFLANSTFSLYGIAAFGTTPTILPKATGGDIVVNDGTFWYHAFLSSGIFIPNSDLTCNYLVVAGGGGGARYTPGGGGAGGLRSTVTATGGGGALESALSLLSGIPIAVTVGAGGAGATTNTTPGIKGNNSVFSTITSEGGGFAWNENGQAGSGGSGGGGARSFNTPGSGTSGQGYAGGSGTSAPNFGGGGGGGAGAVGGNGTTTVGGNGGAGVAISAFASATGTGVSNFYAGGGGGAAYASGGSSGGSGGGGAGTVSPTAPGSGVANTGGGGGSVAADGGAVVTQNGGNGGSGIVIVRYTMA
jgi:hypothetical protein